jgi:hypothetical protein
MWKWLELGLARTLALPRLGFQTGFKGLGPRLAGNPALCRRPSANGWLEYR